MAEKELEKFVDPINGDTYNLRDTSKVKIDGSNATSAGISAALNKLELGTDNFLDGDYVLGSNHNSGSTDNTKFVRRTFLNLYNRIKTNFGISSSGSATKWLNQQGSFSTPTAANVGAAPTSHTHTKSQITDFPTIPGAYTSNPAMDGTASAGSSGSWARGDHVHPHDSSKKDLSALEIPEDNSHNNKFLRIATAKLMDDPTTGQMWKNYGSVLAIRTRHAGTGVMIVCLRHNSQSVSLSYLDVKIQRFINSNSASSPVNNKFVCYAKLNTSGDRKYITVDILMQYTDYNFCTIEKITGDNILVSAIDEYTLSELITHYSGWTAKTNFVYDVPLSVGGDGTSVNNTFPIGISGNAATATTATNATYATKIGTSSSHTGIGSTSQPVYVNTSGEVQPCTDVRATKVNGYKIVVGAPPSPPDADTIYFY